MRIINPEYTVERIVERMKEAVARGVNGATPMNLEGYELTNGIRSKHLWYRQSIREIKAIVRRTLPSDARVIVVSRGDPELLKLKGRHAWHFPQTEEGVYAGQNPANSQE